MSDSDFLTVYHGSDVWFEKPDMDFALMGDGRSVHGMGFNVTDDIEYVRNHLQFRGAVAQNAIIYTTALDKTKIFDRSEKLSEKWLDKAISHAELISADALKADLLALKKSLGSKSEFVFKDYYRNDGGDKIFDGKDIKNGDLQALIKRHFSDQRMENDFLLAMGVQSIRTQEVYVAIDVKGLVPLRVHDICGKGPADMPPNIKIGDYCEQKHVLDIEAQLAKGDLKSSSFSGAYQRVKEVGDPEMAKAFRKLAKTLLADCYLPPVDRFAPDYKTDQRQDMGFSIRDGVGSALLHALDGEGGAEERLAFMKDRIEKIKVNSSYYFDDPIMFSRVDSLLEHIKGHVKRFEDAKLSGERRVLGCATDRDLMVTNQAQTVLTRLASIGNNKALMHAEQAFKAISQLDWIEKTVKPDTDGLMNRLSLLFTELSKPENDNLKTMKMTTPLVTEISKFVHEESRMSDLPYKVLNAIKGFASSMSGATCDISRPIPVHAVKISIPVEKLQDAINGKIDLPQGTEFPIEGHKGWTVQQKDGAQLLKQNGKLSNFVDDNMTVVIPAVIHQDGRAVDVSFENGQQIINRTTVQDFQIQSRPKQYAAA